MIVGIGIDIIEIERIEKANAKNTKFLTKLFTPEENEYFKSKNYRAESIAGLFSAKEAVSKALGTGFRNIKMTDIQICHTQLGQPKVILTGKALEHSLKMNINNISLSISHCKNYATAYVIMESYS